MQQITAKDIDKLISNKEVQFYNFYNVDINAEIYFSSEHYRNNIEEDVDQFVHTIFLDIEVYHEDKSIKFDFDKAIQPINAISFYDNKSNIIYSYFLVKPIVQSKLKSLEQTINEYKTWLVDNKYYQTLEDIKLDISYFTDEKLLIKACWDKIKEIDPLTLSGFASDSFDYPYMYKRCLILFPKETVPNIFSRFNFVDFRNKFLKVPDYSIVDLLYIYKPRDEGGLSLGKKQANYKLNNIAKIELGLSKIEHDDLDFAAFYENEPHTFFLYNIVDVILCKLLNEKLKHIDLLNVLRRMMKIPFSNCLVGSSALFEGYAYHNLSLEKKYVRYGLIRQHNKSIDVSQLKDIPRPETKKNEIIPVNILSREYSAITTKFDGAYVKQPKQQITKVTVIDLDASIPPYEKIFIRRNERIFWNRIGDYTFEEGDETLTWNDKSETCWKKVLGKVSHPWTKAHGKLLKITTRTGKSIIVTNNHSIFGIQKGKLTDTAYIIDAKELKVGDYVVGMKQFEPGGTKTSHNPELLGFWLSDGWSHGKTNFYIAKQDKSKLDVFSPDIKDIRIKRLESDKYKKEWVGTVDYPVKAELNDFRTKTKIKNFIELLHYPLEQRILAWKGMFDADGTLKMHSKGRINATEKLCKYRQPELEECFIIAHTIGWKPILATTGIDNSLKYDSDMVAIEVIRSHKGYGGAMTRLKLSGNNRHPYYKIEKELPYVNKCYNKFIGLETIIKIEEIEYEGDVYDLSVEDTQRFFAGFGLGIHNTGLYPSKIIESNIGFDTFKFRIINPLTYRLLQQLEQYIGIKPIPISIYNTVYSLINKYADTNNINSKLTFKKTCYYTIAFLINKLSIFNIPLAKIFNPTTDIESYILAFYLVPILDIFNTIHPEREAYNQFVYEYVFGEEKQLQTKFPILYILNNCNDSNIEIIKLTCNETIELLQKYSVTISGTCFLKHEQKLGMFSTMLLNMKEMRDNFRAELKKYDKNSKEFTFYNSRQNAVKVVMNRCAA